MWSVRDQSLLANHWVHVLFLFSVCVCVCVCVCVNKVIIIIKFYILQEKEGNVLFNDTL